MSFIPRRMTQTWQRVLFFQRLSTLPRVGSLIGMFIFCPSVQAADSLLCNSRSSEMSVCGKYVKESRYFNQHCIANVMLT